MSQPWLFTPKKSQNTVCVSVSGKAAPAQDRLWPGMGLLVSPCSIIHYYLLRYCRCSPGFHCAMPWECSSSNSEQQLTVLIPAFLFWYVEGDKNKPCGFFPGLMLQRQFSPVEESVTPATWPFQAFSLTVPCPFCNLLGAETFSASRGNSLLEFQSLAVTDSLPGWTVTVLLPWQSCSLLFTHRHPFGRKEKPSSFTVHHSERSLIFPLFLFLFIWSVGIIERLPWSLWTWYCNFRIGERIITGQLLPCGWSYRKQKKYCNGSSSLIH